MIIEENESILKNDIIQILNEAPGQEKNVLKLLKKEYSEKEILPEFFKIISHLEFTKEEAVEHWDNILNHQNILSNKIGRDPGLRVAIMDYFLNINKKLDNPAMIEIYLFEIVSKLALIDELTLLYNRRFFNHAIEKEISKSKRHNLCFSIFFFDIDDFKYINDNYGHSAGDKVLNQIGKVITNNIRKEDIACRYGGEEFTIILPLTPKEGALVLADRMRKKISDMQINEIKDKSITISGGIANFPEDDCATSKELLRFADTALYKSKENGKNKITLFSPELIT